jgi:hypothetical protein
MSPRSAPKNAARANGLRVLFEPDARATAARADARNEMARRKNRRQWPRCAEPRLMPPPPKVLERHFPCCEFHTRMFRTVFMMRRSVALSRAEIFGFVRSFFDAMQTA